MHAAHANPPNVFISYSRCDTALVGAIIDRLSGVDTLVEGVALEIREIGAGGLAEQPHERELPHCCGRCPDRHSCERALLPGGPDECPTRLALDELLDAEKHASRQVALARARRRPLA
jgi:hypothetical protein